MPKPHIPLEDIRAQVDSPATPAQPAEEAPAASQPAVEQSHLL